MVQPVTFFNRLCLPHALAYFFASSAVNAIVTRVQSVQDPVCKTPCCVPQSVQDKAASVNFISFAIPEEKLRNQTGQKKRTLSKLIAGVRSTYRYHTETSYYDQYAESLFGHTKKKLGWDCMRHYEIIAAGAVPLFEDDLTSMPDCVAARLPRDLLRRGQVLFKEALDLEMSSSEESIVNESSYNVSSEEAVVNESSYERRVSVEKAKQEQKEEEAEGRALHKLPARWRTAYDTLQDEFMSYAKANLTTHALAKQWTTSTGLPPGGKVLWLIALFFGETQPTQPFCESDYGRDMLFHGLRQSGVSVVDVPRLDFLYQEQENPCRRLYGHGFSFEKILPTEDPEIASARLNWKELLAAGEFDHVIFSTTAGHFTFPVETFGPVFEMVEEGVRNDSKKVSLFTADDNEMGAWFGSVYPEFLRKGHVFLREGFRSFP